MNRHELELINTIRKNLHSDISEIIQENVTYAGLIDNKNMPNKVFHVEKLSELIGKSKILIKSTVLTPEQARLIETIKNFFFTLRERLSFEVFNEINGKRDNTFASNQKYYFQQQPQNGYNNQYYPYCVPNQPYYAGYYQQNFNPNGYGTNYYNCQPFQYPPTRPVHSKIPKRVNNSNLTNVPSSLLPSGEKDTEGKQHSEDKHKHNMTDDKEKYASALNNGKIKVVNEPSKSNTPSGNKVASQGLLKLVRSSKRTYKLLQEKKLYVKESPEIEKIIKKYEAYK